MGRSSGSGEGAQAFCSPCLQRAAVSACSSALSPSVVPAGSPGMQLPSVLLLPWSRGGNRGVPVWAHHDVRAEKGASGFSCSCLQSHRMMLPRASGGVGVQEIRCLETLG